MNIDTSGQESSVLYIYLYLTLVECADWEERAAVATHQSVAKFKPQADIATCGIQPQLLQASLFVCCLAWRRRRLWARLADRLVGGQSHNNDNTITTATTIAIKLFCSIERHYGG